MPATPPLSALNSQRPRGEGAQDQASRVMRWNKYQSRGKQTRISRKDLLRIFAISLDQQNIPNKEIIILLLLFIYYNITVHLGLQCKQ